MGQFKEFIEKAKADKELGEKLDALRMENAEKSKVISLAAEYGINLTEEDFNEAEKNYKANEKLSEEELESIAGGVAAAGGNCWFTTGDRIRYKHENGQFYLECTAPICHYLFINSCSCHDVTRYAKCINGWHEANEDTKMLKPEEAHNHPLKHYRNNYKV